MIGLLTIGLIGLALCTKKRGVAGIGKVERVKRRIYKEIAAAQKLGVDFDLKYADLSNSDLNSLEEVGKMFGWKQTKRSIESGKLYTEAYYNSLKRAYNAIAGIGIGAADYQTHTIRNGNGKIILQWREYEPVVEHLKQEPIVEIIEQATEPTVHLTKQQQILQVYPYLKTALEVSRFGEVFASEVRSDFNYVIWKQLKNRDGEVLAEGAMLAFYTEDEARNVAKALKEKLRRSQQKETRSLNEHATFSVKHISKIKPENLL